MKKQSLRALLWLTLLTTLFLITGCSAHLEAQKATLVERKV